MMQWLISGLFLSYCARFLRGLVDISVEDIQGSRMDLLPSCWLGLQRKDMYFWLCSSMDGSLAGVTTQVGGIAVGLVGIFLLLDHICNLGLCWVVSV